MKRQSKDQIEAEVILRRTEEPKSRSISTSKSTPPLEASPRTVKKVANKLRTLGLEVTGTSPLTISIAGTKELFERVFHAEWGDRAQTSAALKVPKEMDQHVEGVYVQSPPTYFEK